VVGVGADGELAWGPSSGPDLGALGVLFIGSLILLFLGTWFFKRLEPAFAKVL
jgi:ABC-type polysaccharide/polyol phosphate export permease